MPKRLIITLEYPPQVGGIASYVYNLAAHLPLEETVIYAPQMPGGRAFDSAHPWSVYRLKPLFSWFWPRWLRLAWHIFGIISLEKITELHVHQVLPVGYVAYLIRNLKGVPYTLYLHGTDIELASRPSKRRKLAFLCRGANRIVVNSEFLKNKLQNRVSGLKPISVLTPGPSDVFFEPAPRENVAALRQRLGIAPEARVLLTVSRLVEGKGLPHLARFMPALKADIPSLQWVIVGSGAKRAILENMVKNMGLNDYVHFVGDVPYEELPAYYQAANAFALLTHPDTEAEEGWGTVFSEAAASRLPIVAGRSGGVEEVVENNVTGRVVDTYATRECQEALIAALNDSREATDMAEAAYNRALERLRWVVQVQNVFSA